MENKLKYKPCCGRRCLNFTCETRENGGCYCLCRLIDYIHTLEDIIHDRGVIKYGRIYLLPGSFEKFKENMNEEEKIEREKEKEWAKKELENCNNSFKEYLN